MSHDHNPDQNHPNTAPEMHNTVQLTSVVDALGVLGIDPTTAEEVHIYSDRVVTVRRTATTTPIIKPAPEEA